MPHRLNAIREKAIQYFSKNKVNSDHETAISLFISGVKSANVLILSKFELQPVEWHAYRFMHAQYYKDVQLFSLLNKSTTWSYNPLIYFHLSEQSFNLWSRANLSAYVMGAFDLDAKFFRYLSLSHAFKTEIRFIPLLPADLKLDTPFLSALYDVEVQNQREIQTQIAMLKNFDVPSLSTEEKEEIVRSERETVATAFADFLEFLVSL